MSPRPLALPSLLLAALLVGCGGGGGGGGSTAPTADLAVTLSGPVSVTPGATITWTITVSNTGASPAAAVGVSFALPPGVTSPIAAGATISGPQVTWPALASLASGANTSFSVSGVAPSAGPLDATVSVTTATTETTLANNNAARRTVLGFTALATLTGAVANDYFGFVAESLGDITGDGRPDFVVGAPFHSATALAAGRAYVYSGANAGLLFTLDGAAQQDAFGWGVAAAGDVDGDGVGDVAVGGPGSFVTGGGSTGSGSVRVHSGATGALLLNLPGPAPGSRYGSSVAGIGDVDADGRPDLLIGAEAAAGGVGQAFVVSGRTGATLRTHTGSLGTNYGYGVGPAGDVNGDGRPDYAIGGAQGQGGRVEVRSGLDGALLHTVVPDSGAGRLGFFWIDAVGDVDGDGRPDLFASDIDMNGGAGRAYLASGANGAILRRFDGTSAGENFGISHNGGFDVDGDSVPDLSIAGYKHDEGGTDAGRAVIYSGATGAVLRTITGTTPGQTLGYDFVQLGDVDGDGLVDYLLTGDQENGQPGTLYIVRGTPLP